MEMNKLLEKMKEYEKKELDEFYMIHISLFSDGSGRVISGSMTTPDEKIFEFESLDELYEFLG